MLVYVHAGMHKTGTTRIQATLMENRARLRASGFRIWEKARNDTRVVRAFSGGRSPNTPPAVAVQLRQGLETALREARNDDARAFLLVGEGVSLQMEPGEARTLQERVDALGGRLKVLVYLREPLSFAAAAIQERVRTHGASVARALAHFGAPRYRERLEILMDELPPGALEIRLYDRDAFPDGDVLADYLEAVGAASLRSDLRPSATANERLTVEATYLFHAVRRLDAAAAHFPFRRAVQEVLAKTPGRPFRLPPAVARRIEAEAREDVAWLVDALGRDPFAGLAPPPLGDAEWFRSPEDLDRRAAEALAAARARFAETNGDRDATSG